MTCTNGDKHPGIPDEWLRKHVMNDVAMKVSVQVFFSRLCPGAAQIDFTERQTVTEVSLVSSKRQAFVVDGQHLPNYIYRIDGQRFTGECTA